MSTPPPLPRCPNSIKGPALLPRSFPPHTFPHHRHTLTSTNQTHHPLQHRPHHPTMHFPTLLLAILLPLTLANPSPKELSGQESPLNCTMSEWTKSHPLGSRPYGMTWCQEYCEACTLHRRREHVTEMEYRECRRACVDGQEVEMHDGEKACTPAGWTKESRAQLEALCSALRIVEGVDATTTTASIPASSQVRG